jgi:hypothetical protein
VSSSCLVLQGPLHLNEDGVSGFGTPWEVQVIATNDASGAVLPVRTKGGNVAGYSSLLVVIPEFNVTLAMLWNSPVDEGTVGRHILEQIVPQLYAFTLGKQVFLQPFPIGTSSKTAFGNYTTSLSPGLVIHLSYDNASSVVFLSSNVKPAPQPLSFVGSGPNIMYVFELPWDLNIPLSCQGIEETVTRLYISCSFFLTSFRQFKESLLIST